MRIEQGLTVLVGEHGCGTTTLLRALHDPPRTVLLEAPPGTEWSHGQLVTEALEAPHLVGRDYGTLSGGERQRARLATALGHDGVLLLDEPFGYLDAAGIAVVLRALQGRTAVVACKSDPQVLDHADRVVEVRGGHAVPG